MPFNLSQIWGGWRRVSDAKRAARVRTSSTSRGKTSDVLTSSTSDVEERDVARARARDKKFSEPARGGAKSPSELAGKLLLAPHVSEKSTMHGDGRHVFRVADGANKNSLMWAIKDRYGVDVESVHIIAARDKRRRRGATLGIKSGFKKAIIKLKEGQTINEF